MLNLFSEFKKLLPNTPLQAGTVVSTASDLHTVELPGGGFIKARGDAQVGQRVFVQGGVVQGSAPNLPVELIEV